MGSAGSNTATTPTPAGRPPASARHYRSGIRRSRLFIAGIVIVALGGIATVVLLDRGTTSPAKAALCTVSSPTTSFTLLPEQLINASIISNTAAKVGLSDHAVTVALAAALQESKLRNLTYGDRDSIGLFQQRPSQGWGSADEIIQPTYAATAFYQALAKVPDWETLDVSVAAQRVQRSADGTAYARWEDEARALAVALTGQRPAGLACSGGTVEYHQTADAVATATTTDLGAGVFSPGVTAATGWKAASYLVAHAYALGVTSVSYAGQTWTVNRGTWKLDAAAGNQVTFALATPAT